MRTISLFLLTVASACSNGTTEPGDASTDADASMGAETSTDAPAQDPRCATAACGAQCTAVGLVCRQRPAPCQSDEILTCEVPDAGTSADAAIDAGDGGGTWVCTPCGV